MFSNNIEGIEILKKQLPHELQYWHKFGRNILELHYKKFFDDKYCDYIGCIELLLTDIQYRYTIKMSLHNVTGLVSFDILNGFWSGFTIDDCSDWGYENHCRFRISSFEQDIEFAFYCERIKVELL